MRKWGIVISAFYVLILLAVIVPGAIFLYGGYNSGLNGFLHALGGTYSHHVFWVLAGSIVIGQALLLFLSVDASQKRLKPRTHILLSCAVASMLSALLASGVIWSLGFAIRGDKFGASFFNTEANTLRFWAVLWIMWGIIFYLYLRNSSAAVTRVISWLLKGSILELLIAVPCHIIVRRRGDCSAPAATSFGIATGIAIMLLAFGPSVLFLYKKRLDAYSARSKA